MTFFTDTPPTPLTLESYTGRQDAKVQCAIFEEQARCSVDYVGGDHGEWLGPRVAELLCLPVARGWPAGGGHREPRSDRAVVGRPHWESASDAGRPHRPSRRCGAGQGGWSAGGCHRGPDRTAQLWDARSGELLLTLKGHGDLVVG